jgi:hypothetical protein
MPKFSALAIWSIYGVSLRAWSFGMSRLTPCGVHIFLFLPIPYFLTFLPRYVCISMYARVHLSV